MGGATAGAGRAGRHGRARARAPRPLFFPPTLVCAAAKLIPCHPISWYRPARRAPPAPSAPASAPGGAPAAPPPLYLHISFPPWCSAVPTHSPPLCAALPCPLSYPAHFPPPEPHPTTSPAGGGVLRLIASDLCSLLRSTGAKKEKNNRAPPGRGAAAAPAAAALHRAAARRQRYCMPSAPCAVSCPAAPPPRAPGLRVPRGGALGGPCCCVSVPCTPSGAAIPIHFATSQRIGPFFSPFLYPLLQFVSLTLASLEMNLCGGGRAAWDVGGGRA